MYLVQSKKLSGKELTLYQTIPTFNDPTEDFRKHWEKEKWENAGNHAVYSSFPRVFSALSRREIIILATFNLSSASALDLVQSKKLSGKELILH